MKKLETPAVRGTGRFIAGMGASVLALAIAGPAFAQDAAVTAEAEAEEGEETIVVTGSLLTKTPYNSPDPISIVDPDISKKEGKSDLASALQASPIAAGSTQITSALSSNFVTNGGPGAQTIDLRGLGANRTLVLLNGRRAGPAGTRGAVSSFDLNVLPLSIIKDMQILKTGASSTYGSDAVAGVVNIITEDSMDGFQLDLNVGVPLSGGGEEKRASLSWGNDLGGRGGVMLAVDYSHINELARGDRDYLACPEALIYRKRNNQGGRADLIDPRTGQPKCEELRWGHIWTYNLIDNLRLDGPNGPNSGIDTSIQGDSVLLQYNYPTGPGAGPLNIPAYGAPAYFGDFSAPQGWFPTGYDEASMAVQNGYHPYVEQQSIIPETNLYTGYAQANYEVSDAVELFGEFLYNRRDTYQNGWRQIWNFGYTGDLYGTGAGNYFNYWGGGFQGVNFLSPTGITDHYDSSQKVDYYRGVGGVRGDLGGAGNWKYDIYGQYSKSVGKYRQEQFLQDVYDSGYFQFSSCEGTTLPVSGKACMDLPWADPYFLRGEYTPEQADFMFDWEEGRTDYTQKSVQAVVSGEAFQLPAGPLGVALGASFRRDEINDTPGEITLAGNAWGNTKSGITAGRTDTKELFGEVSIPLLADKSFFKDLSLSAGGRITNVTARRARDGFTDTDNGNVTYKIGLNWAVNDWVRFRGSYGTSYRAPALFEQFLADESGFFSQRADVCDGYTGALARGEISQRIADNCAADGLPADYQAGTITFESLSSGGIGRLKAETSKAWVAGVVLTPQLGANTDLSLAVDVFNIRVKDEVSQLGPNNIIYGCYNSENFANEPLCDLITRNRNPNSSTAYQITTVLDQYINIAAQENAGIDVTGAIRHDLGSAGRISLLADMTWQTKDDTRLLPTSDLESDNGEAGSPKWVGNFRLSYDHQKSGFSAFYGVDVIGGTSNLDELLEDYPTGCLKSFNPNHGNPVPIYGRYCPDVDVPMVMYHNASISQEIADGRFLVTLGVSNLFDKHPPRVSVFNGGQISMLGPVVATSQYSLVGRKAFLNVSAKF